MDKQEIDEIVDNLLNASSDFLIHIIKKSGIRGDLKKLSSLVDFCINWSREKSFLLGEIILPTKEEPDIRIHLFLDAIIDYSEFFGIDYWSILAKVFFCQIHRYLQWEAGKETNYEKAERFASKVCKKLWKQKLINDTRMKQYISTTDRITLTARQKWIEKWLGASLEEIMNLATTEEATTE